MLASPHHPPPLERAAPLDGWAIRWYFWSRSPALLFSVAALLLTAGLAAAWFFQAVPNHPSAPEPASLEMELRQPAPKIGTILTLMSRGGARTVGGLEGEALIAGSALAPGDKAVAAAFWDSLTHYPLEPSADLLYFAHYIHPLAHANELVGDLHLARAEIDRAIHYYQREARRPEAQLARQKLFQLLLENRQFAEARRVAQDLQRSAAVRPVDEVLLAVGERRWLEIFRPLMRLQREYLQPMPVGLAALAGVVWFIIALQALQPPRWICFRTIAPLFAVLAGVLSVGPTLLTVLYQEEMWGLQQTGDFFDDFLYFVAGVGPREEFCKLLAFLPFTPILLKRGSRLEMLMIAGCVGLGFAIEENLQYFAQSGPAIAFGRFITANFFHLAATGLIGLACCDWLRAPLRQFFPFLGKTLLVMLAHGAYDAFLAVEELMLLALVSTLAFMLLALGFFRTLRTLRDSTTDQFSIAATLILGISVLNAAVLVCAAIKLGFLPAVACLAFTAFGLVMITYMFYWQLGEGMSQVLAEEETAGARGGLLGV